MDKNDFRLRFLRKKLYLKEFSPRANLSLLYYKNMEKAVYSVLFNVVDEGRVLIIRDIPKTSETNIAIIAVGMLVEILDPDITHAMINSSWQLGFYKEKLYFYRENPNSCMMTFKKPIKIHDF